MLNWLTTALLTHQSYLASTLLSFDTYIHYSLAPPTIIVSYAASPILSMSNPSASHLSQSMSSTCYSKFMFSIFACSSLPEDGLSSHLSLSTQHPTSNISHQASISAHSMPEVNFDAPLSLSQESSLGQLPHLTLFLFAHFQIKSNLKIMYISSSILKFSHYFIDASEGDCHTTFEETKSQKKQFKV